MKRIKNMQLRKWLVSIGILVMAVFITKVDVRASNWYDSILNSTSGTFKVKNISGGTVTAYRKNYSYYKAIDINGDGVKELFLSTTKSSFYAYGDSIILLSYKNKKVTPLLYISSSGGGEVLYKNNAICHYHRIAGADWYDIYQLKNGTLKSVAKLRRIHDYFGSGKNLTYQEIFYKNDVKCSKSTYNSYVKKYYTGGKKLTYSVIKYKEQNPNLSKTAQHKLYQNTIKNYNKKMKKGAAQWGESGYATYYAFADIDKNGTDELILRYEYIGQNNHKTNIDSGYGENTYIYTIKNGKVKTVLSSGEYSPAFAHENFVRVYKNSNLINRGFSHEPTDDIFYKYSNGVLSSKRSLSLTRGSLWTINGKKSTRQACMNIFNKATNNDTGYSMKRYNG